MEPIDPEVMTREVARLAGDLRERLPVFDERVRRLLPLSEAARVDRVVLTGDGDSHHASCATAMAFGTLAGVEGVPVSAHHFLHYGPPPAPAGRRTLVVATSASGGTKAVLAAAEHAGRHGAATVALTGRADSPVTRAAGRSLLVDRPGPERSPGIRTYQASLLGMLLIALRLAEARDPVGRAEALRRELLALADPLEATASALEDRCRPLAEEISGTPVMTMVGSGPGHGTAMFGAAKVIEASGIFAMGQDLEEWSHVERFARPLDMPVFVIAPAGRGHARAVELADQARGLGRRVVAVAAHDDAEAARRAGTVLPVHGSVREEFSPLLYHLFAGCTARHLARCLERAPFQADLNRTADPHRG